MLLNMKPKCAFVGYRVMLGIIPQETERIRQMMEDLGLNPDDDREDYSSPIGIGNLCGNNVVKDRLDDGINQVSCHQSNPTYLFLTLKKIDFSWETKTEFTIDSLTWTTQITNLSILLTK